MNEVKLIREKASYEGKEYYKYYLYLVNNDVKVSVKLDKAVADLLYSLGYVNE